MPAQPTRTCRRLSTHLLCLSLLCHTQHPSAEPADWYQWQSRFTGKIICKQTDPGAGWQRHDGPFIDAGCRQHKVGSAAGA